MDMCESSNKKKFVFSHSSVSFGNKTIVFETQFIRKNICGGVVHTNYTSPSLSSPWQRLICPVFTIGVLKLGVRTRSIFISSLSSSSACFTSSSLSSTFSLLRVQIRVRVLRKIDQVFSSLGNKVIDLA